MAEIIPPSHPDSPAGIVEFIRRSPYLFKKHAKETQNPFLLIERINDWRKSPAFRHAYHNEYTKQRKQREEEARYRNKPFHEEDGKAMDNTKALLKTFWGKLLKPGGQKVLSGALSSISGVLDIGGIGEQVKPLLEKAGIKIKKVTDKDIILESPDGTIKINKKFFHDLGPNALLWFMFKDIPIKALRLSIQLPGTFGLLGMLAALGPPGMMIGCVVVAMSMDSLFKSITVDLFKKFSQIIYHQVVHGFRGPDGNKLKIIDDDGNINEESVSRIINNYLLNPDYTPPIPDSTEFNNTVDILAADLADNIEYQKQHLSGSASALTDAERKAMDALASSGISPHDNLAPNPWAIQNPWATSSSRGTTPVKTPSFESSTGHVGAHATRSTSTGITSGGP